MNISQSKQYLKIADKHIVEHSIAPLLQCSAIEKIIVALDKDDTYWRNMSIKDHPRIKTCEGGASRALSVRNALRRLKADAKDWVVVHDAVRPCLRATDLEHFIESTWDNPIGAILAIAINDSVKRLRRDVDDKLHVVETLKRNDLWVRAATPQMFRYRLLCDALDDALADGIGIDDEAVAMQHAGHSVGVVLGDYRNIKITYRADVDNAELYLRDESL